MGSELNTLKLEIEDSRQKYENVIIDLRDERRSREYE